ncbi:Outer membrane receptor for ferric coprogen and ferric-rhodotorulic acid [Nostoc flagelliforme CCNUN1]|uniref:Outer membrane receptor for ferric coprogen and ferric-rhodotorulic acid n=1 Tax=Nostoc flagelliforme CCNUN1 TaxID=2038116 RepID=A0A2K8T3C4_9NOSO|nr:Pvc16 family protein [Nostoc flagelliforme]AUB42194.1 Outer membrane receptor for ferric coprogen and ferric-rhodotorulic acid [Nostoc flagelliforme CCNUN1]
MLNSILQTLAEMLTNGSVLTSTEQINFSHPGSLENSNRELSLNLYLYDVRISKKMPNNGRQVERYFDDSRQVAEVSRAPSWFDISIVITARDRTVLGELHLLSETLLLLMRSRILREEFLTPDLRGHGNLSLSVTNDPTIDVVSLWNSLSIPIRPAIYLTVTVPLNAWRKTTVPLVTERNFGVNNSIPAISRSGAKTQRVAIAGIVKNSLNSKPLKRVQIMLQGTEKSVTSNEEGYFMFENLTSGNYILHLRRFGYQFKTCNVFVDGQPCIPKEILLMPAY